MHETETTEAAERYKCSNCFAVTTGNDINPEVDSCPDCKLPNLHEVEAESCPDCGSTEFEMIEQTPPRKVSGPEPTLRCVDCGRSGEIDEDGVWW
jgi:DNA-directed RNA polymerase subunit RPC12/RpoP